MRPPATISAPMIATFQMTGRGVGEEELPVAVQDAQAPGREHEQPGAREENPHEADGQLALLALESRRDGVDQHRRGQHADEDEHRHPQRERRPDRPGDPAGLLPVVAGEQRRVHRNEGRRERAFAEEVLEEVRNPEGRGEGVRGVRGGQEVRQHARADQADDPAEQNSRGDHRRRALGWGGLGAQGPAGGGRVDARGGFQQALEELVLLLEALHRAGEIVHLRLEQLDLLGQLPETGRRLLGPSSRRARARPIGESMTMPTTGIISATSRTSRTIHMGGVYAGSKALSRAPAYHARIASCSSARSGGP